MARNRYFEDEQLTAKFNASMIKRTLRYAGAYRSVLIKIIVTMLIMSFLALTPPMLNRFILDYVVTKDGVFGIGYVAVGFAVVGAWAAVGFADAVYSYFRSFYMNKVGISVVRDIRRDGYYRLQDLSFDYFDSRPAGKILVRLTNYLDDVANIFSSTVVGIIVDGTKVLLLAVWLFILDYRLASTVMTAIVPMGIGLFFLHRSQSRRHRTIRNKVSNRTAFIAENVQGTFVTKAFNRADLNTEIYRDLCGQVNKSWWKMIRFNELFFPLIDGCFQLGILAVYATALFLARNNDAALTMGLVSGFMLYVGMFTGPINNVAVILQQLAQTSSNLERVFEISGTAPSVADAPGAYELPRVEGGVKFENVTFGYEKGVTVLENVNITIGKGQTVALVGPTGAGKSTVINLLSRFYDLGGGRILIDGHDISAVTLRSLRSQVGVMMQDGFIFKGTVMDNIRYARPSATDAECVAAAKAVSADEFIEKLPQGYNTELSEQGAGLSTGERQLLSFARIILTDPKILILDEATSSVDTATEEKIQKALDALLKNRTSIVVAHRLSTIKKADNILFIKDKGVAEQGTHAQLMSLKGNYYNLVTK